MRQFSRRRQCEIIWRSALSKRRWDGDAAKENVKMERDESERVRAYIRVHVCIERRTGAEGSRGLGAQFCSVNPWRRARGVYHSASEFVVPRLVTNKSVFRTQPRTLLSHPPPPVLFPLPLPFSIHGRLPAQHLRATREKRYRASAHSRSRLRNLTRSKDIPQNSIVWIEMSRIF